MTPEPVSVGPVAPGDLDSFHQVLAGMGFRLRKRGGWRRDDIEVRIQNDSGARDPYAGGRFTVEFERDPAGRFLRKLTGRVRFYSLLDDAERSEALALYNHLNATAALPPQNYLDLLHPSLHEVYLERFKQREMLPEDVFLPYRSEADLAQWDMLLARWAPSLVERAAKLDPAAFLLGKRQTPSPSP